MYFMFYLPPFILVCPLSKAITVPLLRHMNICHRSIALLRATSKHDVDTMVLACEFVFGHIAVPLPMPLAILVAFMNFRAGVGAMVLSAWMHILYDFSNFCSRTGHCQICRFLCVTIHRPTAEGMVLLTLSPCS